MSESSSSDWDDEEDLTDLSDDDITQDELNEAITEMHKSIFESKVISTFVQNAHEFGGTNTLMEVINAVERKLGWRTEIVADKNALDDYVFYKYETFNEDMWDHYINSDKFVQLSCDVAYISQRSLFDFADLYSSGPSVTMTLRQKLRAFIWNIYKRI